MSAWQSPLLYRLSPNEEARLIAEEAERRKKCRLLQVRNQAKNHATAILRDSKLRNTMEVDVLASRLKRHWQMKKHTRLSELEHLHCTTMDSIGNSHCLANSQEENQNMQKVVAMNNDHRARSRHQTAMQLLHNENETRNKLQNQRIIFRKSALEVEKARASAIASRTIPIDSVKEALQSTSDIGSEIEVQNSAISYTFNMQGSATVAKATCIHEEPDAIQAAVIEDRLVKQQKELAAKASIDQCGKANIRFKIALRDELMKQHCGRIMADMHGLHQTDRQQKQATVSKIPKFISQLTDGNQRTQQQHHPHPEIGFAGALATEHPDSSLELLEDLGKRMSFHATGSNTTSKQCQYRQSQGDALNKMICNVNKQRIAWVEQAGHHPISPFKRNAHFKGHNSNISDPQFATESAETPCSPAEYNSRAVDGRTSTHLLPHLIGNVNGKTIDCLP